MIPVDVLWGFWSPYYMNFLSRGKPVSVGDAGWLAEVASHSPHEVLWKTPMVECMVCEAPMVETTC